MARPPKSVDTELIEKLAAINCSMEEIASAVKVNRRTLQRRYAAVIEKGRASGKISLKRKMYETAMNGHVTMMIWLSKQMLGYTDKVEEKMEANTKGEVIYKTQWGNGSDSNATIIQPSPGSDERTSITQTIQDPDLGKTER